MTDTSSKDVLRSTIVMFLFVGLVGIWMGGCETQDQKVEKLIQQLKEDNDWHAAEALGSIRRRSSGCGTCTDISITGSDGICFFVCGTGTRKN